MSYVGISPTNIFNKTNKLIFINKKIICLLSKNAQFI